MALAPNFQIMAEGAEKFLRIRKGGYVRPFIDGKTIKSNWQVLLVAWKWRTSLKYEAVGANVTSSGRWFTDLPLVSWGLCPGQAGSLVLNDTSKTTSLFFGFRTSAAGNSTGTVFRSAPAYTGDDYFRPSCFRRHVENGIQLATDGFPSFDIGMNYWTWRIGVVTRNIGAGTTSIWGSLNSQVTAGDVPISQVLDILGQWSPAKTASVNFSDMRTYATATYGWANSAVEMTRTLDTATHGELTHMEWGWWHYGYALDLNTILIKESTHA